MAGKFGFTLTGLLPRVIKAIHVQVSRLVDTTDGRIRKSLMVAKHRMLDCDWRQANATGNEALTQAIGRAAAGAGAEGLIVASAESPPEFNLVLFMNSLRSGSSVVVVK